MRDLLPGFEELHVAKVSDGTFIVRSDRSVVVTAPTLTQAVKKVKEFFDVPKPEASQANDE